MKKVPPLACFGRISTLLPSFPASHVFIRVTGVGLYSKQKDQNAGNSYKKLWTNSTLLRWHHLSVTNPSYLGLSSKKRSIRCQSSTSSTTQALNATPGPPLGNLSIVFTDIVQSTRIWETCPVAMKSALAIHDTVFRKQLPLHQGYEVKSTGDGFMLAFPSTTAAISYCLAVQKLLLDVQWPPEILEMDLGKEVKDQEGKVVFRGLSVRMSAHWGTPVCRFNEVIGRMDYMGPMVHRAARGIERTDGGQISISRTFLIELAKAESDARMDEVNEMMNKQGRQTLRTNIAEIASKTLGIDNSQETSLALGVLSARKDLEIRHLGEYELKGLSKPLQLFLVLPYELRGRLEHYHNQLSFISSWEGLDVR